MSKKLFIVIFLCILFVGFFLRFYRLGDIPNSLDWDEVSQGYNAYSILTTGRDEFGNNLPSTIRSFNDYKPPIYTYLTILPVKIFGLNPFSARFPSAFFGTLSILLTFTLVYEIFRKEKYAKLVALLSMFFFSVSPLSIQFSHTSFDANVGVFLVMLGVWLFIRGLNKKMIWPIFLGVFFLSLSTYSAHSEKIFVPLFFVCLIFYGRKFFINKKTILVCLVVFLAFLNIFWLVNSQTKTRSNGVLFTSSPDFLKTSLNEMVFDKAHNDLLDVTIHNRRFVYVDKYIENYLSHFDLNSLFINGDNARHHAPGMGILYLASLPFILLGTLFVIRKRVYPAFIFFAWILIAPVASSFAIDSPNYQRSLIFLPTFHVFEALGWIYLFSLITRAKFSRFFIGIIIILFSLNVFYYLHQYFTYTNSEYGKYWQFGYKEAIDYTKKYTDTNKKIFFANNIEQGYIFYLFYNKYDPQRYISNSGSNRLNPNCFSIDNAYFSLCKGMIRKGDIYVTSKVQSSSDFKIVKAVRYPDGEVAVWILEYL